MECCWVCYALILLVVYKILDRLIRIPNIGRYSERYILVTGCDTGFGNRLAKRLDHLGCHVFAGCLTEKGETELKKVCSDRLQTIPLDVSKQESVRKAYEFVRLHLPEGKGLWGVMNNAGILGPSGRPEWLAIADYNTVFDINLTGLIDVTMTFLPLVKAAKGRIVNTSSICGRVAIETSLPYCISKYGVEAFTDGLRRSLRVFGCKAVIIEPGIHKTHFMSTENIQHLIENAWKQSTPEIQAEFGFDYYSYTSTKHIEGFQKIGSGNIDDVVDAYERALLSYFPRARYVVGKDAVFIWMPMAMLPEWLSDFLLEKFDVARPLPASLLKTIQ